MTADRKFPQSTCYLKASKFLQKQIVVIFSIFKGKHQLPCVVVLVSELVIRIGTCLRESVTRDGEDDGNSVSKSVIKKKPLCDDDCSCSGEASMCYATGAVTSE